MPTLCTFNMPSGFGQFHIVQDERTAGPLPDIVVQHITDDGAYYVLRVEYESDEAAIIIDMAKEITRLQQLVKGK